MQVCHALSDTIHIILFDSSLLSPPYPTFAGKADQLKSRILEIYPYSTYFGAGYTVQSLDALYGTPGGVIV